MSMGRLEMLHCTMEALDDQQQKGQVGYEQIALIDLPSGELLMDNLGWQAAPATRDKLPELMPLPTGRHYVVQLAYIALHKNRL